MLIESVHNPKIKEARKLRERRDRDFQQLFLIEGYREVSRAHAANVHIHTLFICPEFFLGENEPTLIRGLQQIGVSIFSCTQKVFRTLSYRDRPDGLIAIATHLNNTLENLTVSNNPFYVIAEAIEKPGNLGTILRSSDATHVDGVIVCDRCTDIHNPNVVRASVGTLFTLPVVETSSDALFEWLREKKIAIVAATPAATIEYTDIDLTQPIAIAVGTEQYGLSKRFMQEADFLVKIPMLGVADSLNVAMATTLLLYETVRQRRHGP